MADDKSDDKPAPTEEQVKASNEATEAKWQGDYKDEDLTIPYKQENKDDKKKTTKDEVVEDKTEASKTEDEEPEENADEEPDTPAVEYTEPEPVLTVEDPGDYVPGDYSFEVMLKDGKKVNVSTPEEAEKLADDPDNFETPKQLMDFINKQNKMVRELEKDYEKWEKQHDTFTEQLETETQRRETVENFVNEMNYLVSKNLMPKIESKYVDADWSDPEIAKQSGVKEQIALLDYMTKENETRKKAGVKQITSLVDAYNAWQVDDGHKKELDKQKEAETKAKEEAQARKAAGSRVAGVSPAQQGTYIPKGIAVGRTGVFDRGSVDWE